MNGVLVDKARNAFSGGVIGPDDPGYDEARTVFYGGIDRKPAVIVKPVDATEVARVIELARDNDLELAIRSGGHSAAGFGVSDGIVLHLGDMVGLDIDPDARTAWAQTGLTARAYTEAAGKYGLATGFGDTGSVGIGGLTLGGGVGFLSRKYGMTIDALLGAEVVTADGEVRLVDEINEPDLFWAIRGGGGNFGVATRFKFRLQEVSSVVGGMLILPATPEVIADFVAAADAAPEELTTIANVMVAPPMPFVPAEFHGKLIVLGLMAYAGDVEAGERAVAPFRKLATPLADMLRPMTYPEIFFPDEPDMHPHAAGRTMFVDDISSDDIAKILERLQGSSAMMAATQIRILGGAVARVPADATAFAHRSRPIMLNLAALFGDPAERSVHDEWVEEFLATLQVDDPAAYVNFLDNESEERVRQAYPEATWNRLAAIKRRYDPDNVFRVNQNIPPA